MKLDPSLSVGIIGLGLMGGSYAMALSAKGYRVGAVDLQKESLQYALDHGIIAHGQTEVTADYIGQFDLLVFALYPHTFLEWLERYAGYIKSGAIVTDVTGVKAPVVYRAQELLSSRAEYIPAHPMAGRESGGVQNANTEMFADANYIVTPTAANTPQAIAFCEALGRELGFCNITRLTPEQHDQQIAFLSQLTHCVAVSLMTCRDTESLAAYSGDSFRDLTRIAKINDVMWSELFLSNREALLGQMECFEQAFHSLYETIRREDREQLQSIMRRSTRQRELFDEKKKERS